jgi:hypothetical protein
MATREALARAGRAMRRFLDRSPARMETGTKDWEEKEEAVKILIAEDDAATRHMLVS